ncbi:MAG: sugar phosphate isomerase/epimerase [Phycisphaerae bacterium]|nr:sugar phosphate isomerase/epimerase [Phycisphaerae bacterium]
MIKSGLVSITFRKLSPEEVVALVSKAGLDGIEWGGDIHVPHGNTKRAAKVRKMTLDAGLAVAAYGSYYKVGHEEDSAPFESVVASAVELGAPTIRVWAGAKGSAEADDEYRSLIVHDSQRIADLAGKAGITVSYEFHPNTLTDTNESTVKLLQEVANENIRTYWQPPSKWEVEHSLEGLQAISLWLTNVHAYYCDKETGESLPLADGKDAWGRYLPTVAALDGEHYVMLEFVKDNSPEVFLADAATLKNWLQNQ